MQHEIGPVTKGKHSFQDAIGLHLVVVAQATAGSHALRSQFQLM